MMTISSSPCWRKLYSLKARRLASHGILGFVVCSPGRVRREFNGGLGFACAKIRIIFFGKAAVYPILELRISDLFFPFLANIA